MPQDFNIAQIKEIIKFSLENSTDTTKLPISLCGIHGVGKTELVKQVAKENGYNLIVLHLAMQDICDLIGIPAKVEHKLPDGSTDVVQIWSCPQWLHDAVENYKKTGVPNLFFLDEWTRGNRFVLSAMLPFLIEGVLHQHKIGPKDAVIAACNPATDKYEVNEVTDEALLNRLGHCIFKPTHTEYVKYLKSQGIDKTTLKVISSNPSFTKISDFDLGFEVKPSRRSIFNVMSVIGKKSKEWINQHASYVIEAYLGSSFRDEWVKEYLTKEETITIEMLLDFDSNKNEIEQLLTTSIDGIVTHRSDLLSKCLDLIKTYITDNKDKLTIKDIEWMTAFFSIKIIPDDSAAAVFMANPHIKALLINDIECNLKIMNFLVSKKIIQQDEQVKLW